MWLFYYFFYPADLVIFFHNSKSQQANHQRFSHNFFKVLLLQPYLLLYESVCSFFGFYAFQFYIAFRSIFCFSRLYKIRQVAILCFFYK